MSSKAGWFGGPASQNTRTDSRDGTKGKPSLELRTTIASHGTSANAMVEQVTGNQCRLRSVVMLDMNELVSFDVAVPGKPPMSIHGHVTSRARSGPRFIYTIALDRMSTNDVAELGRSLTESNRDRPTTRLCKIDSFKDLPTPHGLMRAKIRSAAEFPLTFRTAKEAYKTATADNVSTGGLLITSQDALVEGMLLELRFTLPDDVLDVYPEETAVVDLRNPCQRKMVKSRLRAPFSEIVVQARVTRHQPLASGGCQYGLAFMPMPKETREEIARYVDAVRHTKT